MCIAHIVCRVHLVGHKCTAQPLVKSDIACKSDI